MDKRFCIYITNKRNGTIYIGVTNDLARRVYEHREGLVHGFTTRYGLKMLVHYEVFELDLARDSARDEPQAMATTMEAGSDREEQSTVEGFGRRGCLVILSQAPWITAAATVIPVLGPALGITLPADVITTFGNQAMTAVQALAGLFGTVLAIYGRLNAAGALTLRKG